MGQIGLIAGLGVTVLLAGYWLMQTLAVLRKARVARADRLAEPAMRTMFLFEGQRLHDATPAAHALLSALPEGDAWTRLSAYLASRFPQAVAELGQLSAGETRVYLGSELTGSGQLRLTAEAFAHRLRLTIGTVGDSVAAGAADGASPAQSAAFEELSLMRQSLEKSPVLVWREDPSGAVIWANAAYRALLCDSEEVDAHPWPLPALFAAFEADQPSGRARLERPDTKAVCWFDLHDCPAGEDQLRFAIPADAAVQAQSSLREFIQTLAKTFADLPIGLAVFDRQRRLQMFNPALGDLTTLDAGFLTARPTLEDFLDRLREARMMPEPKDYRGWRQRMIALETAAASGYHSETWSLPDGQTYRVTGRPHPDGAVAFLFEDITAGMTLTRKFRAEIDLGREILDGLPEPVCVIAEGGDIVVTNATYRKLWPDAGPTLPEALSSWTAADPGWGAGDALECALLDRTAARTFAPNALRHPEAGALACHVVPLSGGRNLVRFEQLGTDGPAHTAPLPMGAGARTARELAALSRQPRPDAAAGAGRATKELPELHPMV